MPFDATLNLLKQHLGAEVFTTSEFRDNRRIQVAPGRVLATLECLKTAAGFDMLIDITAADYLYYPDAKDRFGVMYCLLNTGNGERVVVKTLLNEPELTLPTAYGLWKGANWLEREIYDMYGIVFEGHPDLRRILMPEQFTAYPLRKDYPLRGRGERHNFHVLTRAEG